MIADLVETLLRCVQGSTVTEIEYEHQELRLRLVREPRGVADGTTAAGTLTVPGISMPTRGMEPRQSAPTQAAATQRICASMHGSFYRAIAPGEPALVEPGQQVEAGAQLGLLEAMKMLHPVEAEITCRIVRVLAENAAAVEPGTPLFEIEAAEVDGV